ncbi:MAG TPA: lysozyme inhibitor LprI family protein [Flavipsychrobacter sp.]
MKPVVLFFICFLSSWVCTAQTQLEMNVEAYNAYMRADSQLNTVYNKILAEYRENKSFITHLKKAQRAWINFRDAEVNAKYPPEERPYYGSVFPVCHSIYLQQLTEIRINDLNVWLTGIEEGDACLGSVKMKE